MEAHLRVFIERLHHAPCRFVLAMTGGGTQSAAWLLGVPGGSRTVLEIAVPYHEGALDPFLGFSPANYCSAETAVALADRAFDRAAWLAPGEPAVGLGCTASLATDRPKKGDHRVFLASRTADRATACRLILTKGARDREGEEALVSTIVLNALAEAAGIKERLPVALGVWEAVETRSRPLDGVLPSFLRGEVPAVLVEIDGRVVAGAAAPPLLFPGAFNPVHEGHLELAEAAGRRTGLPVALELSVANADKPPLERPEVDRRLVTLHGRYPVWLTRAPRFSDKAGLFPGTVFVVGADTAVRIVSPRYYQDSEAHMAQAFRRIRDQGCRFLVAGRLDPTGNYQSLATLEIPDELRDLFAEIPEAEFRRDISSTHIRGPGSDHRSG